MFGTSTFLNWLKSISMLRSKKFFEILIFNPFLQA